MNYPISFYPIWREDKRWQPMELSDMDVTPLSNTFYRFFKYLNYILSYHSIPVHFALLYCILLIQTCLIRASDNWNQTTKDILRISQKTSSTQNRLSIKVNHNQNMTQRQNIYLIALPRYTATLGWYNPSTISCPNYRLHPCWHVIISSNVNQKNRERNVSMDKIHFSNTDIT